MTDYSWEEAENGFSAVEWAIQMQVHRLTRMQVEGESFPWAAEELSSVLKELHRIARETFEWRDSGQRPASVMEREGPQEAQEPATFVERLDALEKAVSQVDGRATHGLNQVQDQIDGLRKQFGKLETEVRTKINAHCDQSDRGYKELKKLLGEQRSAHDALLQRVAGGERCMGVLQDQCVEFDQQTAKQIERIDGHAQGLEQEVWKKFDALDARTKGNGQGTVLEPGVFLIDPLPGAQALIHELYLEQFPQVSDKDYKMMAHACGAESDPPYLRNYYSAPLNSDAAERWDYLEQEGLAFVQREPDSSTFPDRLYALTKEGLAFVLAWKATRSKEG